MSDEINTFLDKVLIIKDNHEEFISINLPDDPLCGMNEWRSSIKKIIIEDKNFDVDMRTTKILMCALNSQMNEMEFTDIINRNNLKDKFTYALICDFKIDEQENIQDNIRNYNGIFKSEVNSKNDPEDNLINCVFNDPITTFKFIKSFYLGRMKEN